MSKENSSTKQNVPRGTIKKNLEKNMPKYLLY